MLTKSPVNEPLKKSLVEQEGNLNVVSHKKNLNKLQPKLLADPSAQGIETFPVMTGQDS